MLISDLSSDVCSSDLGGDSGIVVDKALSPSAAAEGGSILIIVNRSSITSDLLDVSRGGTGSNVEIDGATVSLAEGEASGFNGSGFATDVDSSTVRSSDSLVNVILIATVPTKGSGRSPASQITAGAKRKKVNVFDHPLSLITVAFQMALPSGVGCSMP